MVLDFLIKLLEFFSFLIIFIYLHIYNINRYHSSSNYGFLIISLYQPFISPPYLFINPTLTRDLFLRQHPSILFYYLLYGHTLFSPLF